MRTITTITSEGARQDAAPIHQTVRPAQAFMPLR
jgi:hypothetical protein